MLNAKSFANAVTVVSAVAYLLCELFSHAVPGMYWYFLNSWAHGINLEKIQLERFMSLEIVLFGFASFSILVWILTYLTVRLYNQFSKNIRNKFHSNLMSRLIYALRSLVIVATLFISSCSKKEEVPPSAKDSLSVQAKPEAKTPSFSIELTTEPSTVSAGTKTMFKFVTKSIDTNGAQVPVVIQNNSEFDVVVTDENLSYMEHSIAKQQPNGAYAETLSLPSGGKYFVFASFQPQNAYAVTTMNTIEVKGNPSSALPPKKDVWKSSADGISVTLKTIEDRFITGVLSMGFVSLTSNGKPIDSSKIQDIYGAKAHLFLIGDSTKEYFHSYPEIQDDKLEFHVFFKKADRYEGRLLVMTNKKIHTFPLTINVYKGSKEEVKESNEMHSDFHTSDTHQKHNE